MPTDPRSAAAVGRLYQALRASLEGRGGAAGEVTVSEIYQTLVPYARARSELGFEMNADYEHALMRLIAGEGGFARLEPPEARAQVTRELESSNPDVTIYRRFAASTVRLSQSAAPTTAASPARETPAAPAAPAAPASHAVRDTPPVREAPAVRETPAVRDTPPVRETPRVRDTPAAPAAPDAPALHAVRETPAVREAPAAPASPAPVGTPASAAAAKAASAEGAARARSADAATRYVAVPGADRPPQDAAEAGSGSRREGPEGAADATSAADATLAADSTSAADPTSESASWRQALERVAAPLARARDADEELAERSERALDHGLARLSSLLDAPAHTDRTAEHATERSRTRDAGQPDATEASRARDAGQPDAASPEPGHAPEDASPEPGHAPEAASPDPGETSGAASRRPDACGSCGKSLPTDRDARFCPYCGSEQPDVCADCGDDMEPDWRYCPSCGREA